MYKGGTARPRGKKGEAEGSNLKSRWLFAVTDSNVRQRRADERADDRTKEDRYEVGAGPLDLWDSWSKGLGEVIMMTESNFPRATWCVSCFKCGCLVGS